MKVDIEFNEVSFDVEFDYQPYEAPVMYYSDGSGHPGCAESMDICSVTYEGREMIELLDDDLDEIEELTWAAMEANYDPGY